MADPREGLVHLLASLGESCQFATYGSMGPVLPGLDVEGVGTIGLPVSPTDASRLIAMASQAPYGRGEETIIDPNVRRVWQIEPSQFNLRNPQWDAHLAEIVAEVTKEFGIADKVLAKLYKLLIYEKGSFFTPHRDTEKTSGMFGTLVVGLPSRHEGGRLIVRHDRQTKTIEFAGSDAEFKTQYAAFYADCQHEIEPVTDGYRVCLVYNLATVEKTSQPAAPQSAQAVDKAAELLTELFAGASNELNKIVIPFTHQYTEAGLDPRHLKGADRPTADVLTRAAESLGYACYVALLTHWQSGGADYSTYFEDDYGWGRRHGRSQDRDVSRVEIDEVIDESMSLDHWLYPDGQQQSFGEIQLEENEVLGGMEGWSYEQEVHEATGNEGATVERWYRHAVTVVWPPNRTFAILATEGQATALPELERMVAEGNDLAALERCRDFAEQIIAHWQPGLPAYRGKHGFSARMLDVLQRIGNEKLVRHFVNDVLPKDFDGSEGNALVCLGERFGWDLLADSLPSFVAQQKRTDHVYGSFVDLPRIVSLCRPLFSDPPAMSGARRTMCESLADELVQVIERADTEQKTSYAYAGRRGVVDGVVRIFAAVKAQEPLDWFVSYVLEDARHYDLRDVLVGDVQAIYGWLADVPAAQPAAERLLEHCRSRLQEATRERPSPPADWSRPALLNCECGDCRDLVRFLRDPKMSVGRFPLRKDRRQHLHGQIERHQLDCTHETERIGSPQTLVCKKTQASFERELKQYEADCQVLAALESLVISNPRSRGKRAPAKRKSQK